MPQLLNVHRVVIAIALALVINMVPAQAEGQTENSLRQEMLSIMADEGARVKAERFNNLDLKSETPNIYFTLYNEIILEADRNARKNVARSSGTTRTGVDQALNTANTDNQDLLEEYERERQFFEMLAAHENETLALEMFSNGSTRDAHFDLLKDLERIQKILFGKEYDSQIDLSGSSGNRTQSVSQLFTEDFGLTGGDTSSSSSSSTPESRPIQINPEICQLEEDLIDNLNEYHSESGSGSDDEEGEEASDGSTPISSGERKALNPLQPKDPACTDTFCLTVERTYKTRTSYTADSNDCIACTVEEIASITDVLVEESLIPRKITGNFGEPNICKESFAKNILSMRIALLKRPIVPETNIAFEQATELSPSEVQNAGRDLSATTVDPSTNLVDQTIASRTTLGDIDQTSISNVASEAEYQDQINQGIRSNLLTVVQDINSNAALADALSNRMQTMTIYFESYQEILTEIQSTLNDVTQKDSCENL